MNSPTHLPPLPYLRAGLALLLAQCDLLAQFAAPVADPRIAILVNAATGDVNGDGRTDLVTASGSAGQPFGGFEVQLGAAGGCGSFDPVVTQQFGSPSWLGAIATQVANVNSSPADEIVVLTMGSLLGAGPQVNIYSWPGLTSPTAVLTSPYLSAAVTEYPNRLMVADLDADGDQDIAVGAEWGFLTWSNNGNGTFSSSAFQAFGRAIWHELGRFDADHLPDLVTMKYRSGWYLDVHRNLGGMTFDPVAFRSVALTVSAGTGASVGLAHSMAVADFDNDGIDDVAYSEWQITYPYSGPARRIYLVKSLPGSLDVPRAIASTLNAGQSPAAVAAADFNCDGHIDLAYGASDGSVRVRWNDLHGQLDDVGSELSIPSMTADIDLLAADLNRDGAVDLVACSLGLPSSSVSFACNQRVCETEYIAFVFDRSASMATVANGSTMSRAQSSQDAADGGAFAVTGEGDLGWMCGAHANRRILLFETRGSQVRRIGGIYTTEGDARAAIRNRLSAPVGGKAIAAAICRAVDELVALNPTASIESRSLLIYSDGGADVSPASSCRGGRLSASAGNWCGQELYPPSSPVPFTPGSWQQAVCDVIDTKVQTDVYCFSEFADTVDNEQFYRAICELSGGTLVVVPDGVFASGNPWRRRGRGCVDHLGRRLRLAPAGFPQLGRSVELACRTGTTMPSILGVGMSDQVIGSTPLPYDLGARGAPGCSLFTSWDSTDSMLTFGGVRTLTIPAVPALAGLVLHWQGAEFHPSNNALGVSLSDLVSMRIVP